MVNINLSKGLKALSVGEWENAKRFFLEALKIEESPQVLEGLASTCWWLNDAPGVFEYRLKAYNSFLNINDKLGASRMASWIGIDYLEFKSELAVASGWFQRAENLLEGLNGSKELSLIKVLKARLTFMLEKNTELAAKLADESLQISKSLNSIEGEMLAEAFKGFILVTEGKISEGMTLLDDATVLALTADTTDINIVTITCCFLIDACERIRDYERAGQWCLKVKEICSQWRHRVMFATCRTQYAVVLIWRGDWKEAEEELLSAANELREFRPTQVNASIIKLADLKRRQGKWQEARKLIDEVESHWLKPLVCAALNYDAGDYETACDFAVRFLRQIPYKEKTERIAGVELLLQIYVKLGKPEQAVELRSELEEIAETIQTLPIKASVFNAEGALNYAFKKYELAKQNYEDAIDIYDKIISPFESARARLALSELMIKLKQYSRAEYELDIALKIFQKLGAEKDFEKTKNLLRNLYRNNVAPEVNNDLHNITSRELEVLSLIARGKNNSEIAEKLFLSVRTVEKHIANIYQKLGISGKSARAFAASYTVKKNLTLS